MSKQKMGSGIDDFLKEEGIFDGAQARAVKELVTWQLGEPTFGRFSTAARSPIC